MTRGSPIKSRPGYEQGPWFDQDGVTVAGRPQRHRKAAIPAPITDASA